MTPNEMKPRKWYTFISGKTTWLVQFSHNDGNRMYCYTMFSISNLFKYGNDDECSIFGSITGLTNIEEASTELLLQHNFIDILTFDIKIDLI